MTDWKKESYLQRLQSSMQYFARWADKASAIEEKGEQEFGKTWRQMASEKADDIRDLLDEAERSGITIPDLGQYEVGSIPTRFKMREEIARLQAALVRKDEEVSAAKAEMAEVRKHLAKESVGFFQARERLETELHTWECAGVFLFGVALLGWLR